MTQNTVIKGLQVEEVQVTEITDKPRHPRLQAGSVLQEVVQLDRKAKTPVLYDCYCG